MDRRHCFSRYKDCCQGISPWGTSIDGVVGTPFVDIGWESQGNQLIIVVAIDNLLKGAASQAVQCMNLNCGLPSEHGLL